MSWTGDSPGAKLDRAGVQKTVELLRDRQADLVCFLKVDGAARVGAAALRDAQRNVLANTDAIGADAAERHATLRRDLLSDPSAALADPRLAGSDLIVLDPPSLARRKGQRHAALRSDRRLNAAALAALPQGGVLAFPEGRYLKFVLLRVTRPAPAGPATTAGARR